MREERKTTLASEERKKSILAPDSIQVFQREMDALDNRGFITVIYGGKIGW